MAANVQEAIRDTASPDAARSSSGLYALMRFAITEPTQTLTILNTFCGYLDSKNMPASIRPTASDEINVDRALNSMKGVALVGTLRSTDSRVIEALRRVWPHVMKWLQYLHTFQLDNEHLGSDQRVAIFTLISGAHKVFNQTPELQALTRNTPGYFKLLVEQWKMQIRVPGFISNPPIYPLSNILTAHTNTLIPTAADAISTITTLLGGPDDVARIALEHLSASAEQTKSQANYSVAISADIDFIANLRTSAPIRYALLSRHAVRAVTNLFFSLTAGPVNKETADSVTMCMVSCGHFLGFALEQSNGLPWVIEALNNQLVSAYIRCSAWMPYMKPVLVKHFLVPLRDTLPKYLMYVSVLKAAQRGMKKAQPLEAKMIRKGPLWESWSQFKKLADERIGMLSESNGGGDKHQVCFNPSCRKVDTQDAFLVCNGCNDAYFCSKPCQDAMQEGHRRTCEELQVWRRDGKTAPMFDKDFAFAGQVAQRELSKRLGEAAAVWEREMPKVPVIELDFTASPMKVRIGSATTVRPSDYATDSDERTSWDALVKKAEDQRAAIARFCIPEGEYQKVGVDLLKRA
ncbi:hypothetical protein Hypma_001711 [Hypsizygus marmoreus]|uniref:MYND-type domain-containing protein n=1 Tax=Hypsizygus marmoreus TaxID=39966 RepID=A0A369JDZ7_HYPMA|nr:hypothetical protein Hypma_001711 [Hypsizygus marmoreus]